MKRILILLTALAALAVFGGTSFGKEKVKAKAKAKVVETHKFSGTVLWVDPVQNMIALKGGEEEARFRILPTTTIKRRGKVVILSRLEKGDKVTVAYRVQRNTRIAAAIF